MSQSAEIGAVIISRNEEAHIEQCIFSVMAALKNEKNAPIVLVDSDSRDNTISLATQHPISVYQYHGNFRSAAAGRRIGSRFLDAKYILFVDGDCEISPEWVDEAIGLLRNAEDVAVIHGRRQELYLGASGDRSMLDKKDRRQTLGGNAIYRASALRRVGSFNPFLLSEEEGELLGRLLAAGYRELVTDSVMIRHNHKESAGFGEILRRLRLGFGKGVGQVLRVSISQGTAAYHFARFNRYLAALAYLIAGAGALLAGILFTSILPLILWAGVGCVGLFVLAARRRSLKSAAAIIMDWFMVAIAIPRGFAPAPRDPESFQPRIDQKS